MKKYMLTLLVSLVSVASFAQDQAQVNPFENASEIVACYGDEVAVESVLGLDASGSVVAGLLLLVDPASGAVTGGSSVDVSSVSKDDSAVKAEGVLVDWGTVSYVLEVSRAAADVSYVDEANNTVTVPTYAGSITVSDGTQTDVLKVTCIVEAAQ